MTLPTSEVRVADRVAPGLVVRGPVGSGDPMTVRSPWDGAEIATMATTTLDEADAVLDRARAAFEFYRWTPAWKRAQILERASHLLEENLEQVARIIASEGGKPLKDARTEVRRAMSTFRWSSEEAKRTGGEIIEMDADSGGEHRFGWTFREPRGVIVAISPFNFPLNLVAHKVAPALAAGNVVVLKPASTTPITALRLAELLTEAGLPEDVLQVVVGPGGTLGNKLVMDDRVNMVSFTGSPPVGRKIASDAGMKMVTLELGNNSATIVDEDANLELAAQRVVAGGFANSGRSASACSASSSTRRSTTSSWACSSRRSRRSRSASPLDEATDVSTLISAAEVERVKAWIQEAVDQGATLATGGVGEDGPPAADGPDDVTREMKVCAREVFGPGPEHPQGTRPLRGDRHLERQRHGPAGRRLHERHQQGAVRGAPARGRRRDDQRSADLPRRPHAVRRRQGLGHGREGAKFAIREMTELKMVDHPRDGLADGRDADGRLQPRAARAVSEGLPEIGPTARSYELSAVKVRERDVPRPEAATKGGKRQLTDLGGAAR